MKINIAPILITLMIISSCKKSHNSDDGGSDAKDTNVLLGVTTERRSEKVYGVCGSDADPATFANESLANTVKRNFNAVPAQFRSILVKNLGKLDFDKPNIKLLDDIALTAKCAEIFDQWATIALDNIPEKDKQTLADTKKSFEVAKSDPQNHRLKLNGCWGLTGPDATDPSKLDQKDPTRNDVNVYILNDRTVVNQQLLALAVNAVLEAYLDVVWTPETLAKFAKEVNGKEGQTPAELLSFYRYFADLRALRSSLGEKVVNYLQSIPDAKESKSLFNYTMNSYGVTNADELKKNVTFLNRMTAEFVDDRHCNRATNHNLEIFKISLKPGASAVDLDTNIPAVVKALDTYLGLPWYEEQVAAK